MKTLFIIIFCTFIILPSVSQENNQQQNDLEWVLLETQGYHSGILADQSIGEFSIKQDCNYKDQKLVYYRNVIVCQVLYQQSLKVIKDTVNERIFVIKDSHDMYVMDYSDNAKMKHFDLPSATSVSEIKKTAVNKYTIHFVSVDKTKPDQSWDISL